MVDVDHLVVTKQQRRQDGALPCARHRHLGTVTVHLERPEHTEGPAVRGHLPRVATDRLARCLSAPPPATGKQAG
ncbi:hypothetical protein GCM10023169_33060 [Georgenia halophila]|uniref:Uncharacterized protein n=1 Tax=Georgenia halophila TaxID=620889 RepID=A0ABP8LJ64_9MICO